MLVEMPRSVTYGRKHGLSQRIYELCCCDWLWTKNQYKLKFTDVVKNSKLLVDTSADKRVVSKKYTKKPVETAGKLILDNGIFNESSGEEVLK